MPPKRTTACPARWGKGAWMAIHQMTTAYPDRPTSKDKAMFRFVFKVLPKILPCNVCARHFKDLLRTMPVEKHLGSRPDLMQWAHRAHAKSNKNVPDKKKERPPELRRVLPTFAHKWQKGLRDYLFVTVMCLPSKHADLFAKWTRVMHRALGDEAPVIKAAKRSDMLNQLCKFYKVGKTKVVRRYTPWLNVKKEPDTTSKVKQVLKSLL
jgi:hypothetical protein